MDGVKWLRPASASQFVRDVLRLEAPDIPAPKLDGLWSQRTLAITELSVNEAMVAEHDVDAVHRRRRDGFVSAFRSQDPVPPLIALGPERYLVDGYARLRAARFLGLRELEVLVQDGEPTSNRRATPAGAGS